MKWVTQVLLLLHEAFDNGWYIHDSHAIIRQSQRGITDYDVEDAICADWPEVIKNYPNYWKGPAVLIRGVVHNRILHIFCTLDDPPLFVTCYRPDPKIWYPGFRRKRKCGHEMS